VIKFFVISLSLMVFSSTSFSLAPTEQDLVKKARADADAAASELTAHDGYKSGRKYGCAAVYHIDLQTISDKSPVLKTAYGRSFMVEFDKAKMANAEYVDGYAMGYNEAYIESRDCVGFAPSKTRKN
jgi:hypothetical protein